MIECPYCENTEHKVTDTRKDRMKERKVLWRRRECLACKGRFNTYECLGGIEDLTGVKTLLANVKEAKRLLSSVVETVALRDDNRALAEEYITLRRFLARLASKYGQPYEGPKEYAEWLASRVAELPRGKGK